MRTVDMTCLKVLMYFPISKKTIKTSLKNYYKEAEEKAFFAAVYAELVNGNLQNLLMFMINQNNKK